jgi:hypothetical protein
MWKTVTLNEKYEVSDKGEVRNAKTKQVLRLTVNKYPQVSLLYPQRKSKTHVVHRLVALAFIPNPNNAPEVNHINGIKTDNNISNLEWVTRKENIAHAIAMGLNKSVGEEYIQAQLEYAVQATPAHFGTSVGFVMFGVRDYRKTGMLSTSVHNCINRPPPKLKARRTCNGYFLDAISIF